ncbi:hypothetical protein [Halorussus pelagicus]|uniref:hypothetical protein n=1 Tax=Halorussus pelagicus TaxID=2505977 RepID=UPI000FFC5C64|nr:hypothetical protein [Halorussus pelagicus]
MAPENAHTESDRWREAPRDPDPSDLGYELDDWEVIRARKDDRGHLMFLPEEEEMLRDEAFIVADACSVCDVVDRI